MTSFDQVEVMAALLVFEVLVAYAVENSVVAKILPNRSDSWPLKIKILFWSKI